MGKALVQEMQSYFTQLDEAEQKSVILMLKTFLKGKSKQEMGRMDIEQYNKEIDEAIARVEASEYYTQDEVETMAKEW